MNSSFYITVATALAVALFCVLGIQKTQTSGAFVISDLISSVSFEFKSRGIVPFIDNEIKRGESVGPELFRAIRESKIAIVLLSKNYSSSSWCLKELVEIMRCRDEIVRQTVLTVFYQVDPSDVRKQTGDFGKAFDKTCVGKTEEVNQRWRRAFVRALMDVANILGEDSRNWDLGSSWDWQDHRCKISGDFQFAVFIENIRLTYMRRCHDEGFLEIMNGAVQERLKDHNVLVILDGVDHLEQLKAMAEETQWFGYGSRIIITTQDQRLLSAHVPPHDGFKKLAMEFTQLAGELPLGLRVMGSYLRGMSLGEWEDALPRLRTSLDGEIGEIERTLRFSYDALSYKDKALFLHIACLFHGFRADHVKQWLANSGLDVNHGLEVLTRKSLKTSNVGFLGMHSLLQQLGVDIVRKESIREPGKRQFLVDVDDISDVITDNAVRPCSFAQPGIMLNISKIEDALVVEESVFDGMTNLQLQRWDYCPLRVWPSTFSTKFLVELIMRGSKFEKLWEGIQRSYLGGKGGTVVLPATRVRALVTTDLTSLPLGRWTPYEGIVGNELPNLSNATNLESFLLSFCTSLLEIPSSVGNGTSLKTLDLSCTSLVNLPSSICNATKITTNIQELNLSSTAIEEMPSSLRLWSCLYKLEMQRCRSLKVFPPVPEGIEELDLSDTLIEEVPPWIENLSQLRHLAMFRCWKLDNVSLSRISKMVGVSCMHITRGDKDTSRLHQTTSSTKTAFTL
ncbi:unnamed protein product [Brassica oleracea]